MMLEAAVKFEKAFDRLEDEDASYRHDMSPNKEDWTNARMLIWFLKVFYDVTLKILGSLYTTSNLVFHQITVVQNCIRLNAGSANALLVGMANNMKAKFEKYWGNNERNNLLLYVAIVLDPRKKLRFVSFCLKNFFGPEVAESMGNVEEQCCRRLFHEYSTTRSGSRQGCSSTSTTSTQTVSCLDANIDFDSNENVSEDFVYDTIVEEFEDDVTTPFEEGSSEIDIYLLEANVRTEVSTVASESAFSSGGCVVDSSHCSLAPKTVEALICTQNWLNSYPIHLQIQHELEEASKFEEGQKNRKSMKVHPKTGSELMLCIHVGLVFHPAREFGGGVHPRRYQQAPLRVALHSKLAKCAREVSKFASIALVDIDSEEMQVYVKYFDITLIPSTVFFFNAHHMKMDSGTLHVDMVHPCGLSYLICAVE
ncbi:zinc finger BED domain-containing protein RICESLEEPER 2-like [Cucumis melo var. makuwa]|uniref:Zinc finger BED domain-containing protein RICESLEEPER 2-like n=1 Tax=Cucumis melo var. makuwa TaxID=1194695 RepID=A0A5D3DTY7_CUCMM|nr:zinc finger BED domain-containing protein RICESLEEPER 2-like [Cucumis melo var. makuwa]TYK26750.1 zinc finger BED domain-containing protein RICESLEEPER 2-like [Cucumis melo var. makuwa]